MGRQSRQFMPIASKREPERTERPRLTMRYKSWVDNARRPSSSGHTLIFGAKPESHSRRTTMRTRKIDRVVRMLKIAAGIGGATCALGASAIEPTASVIEYYNATLNHFFI